MSRNTQSAIKTAINLFENFCIVQFKSSSDSLFAEINRLAGESKERAAFDVLQDFINHLDKQNLTGWTIKLTVLRLKPYFSYRSMMKLHNEDIKSELKLPKNIKRKPEPLSVQTIQKVLEYSSPERRALYVFLVSTGVRIGEAVQLRKRDFEPFGQRFKVSIRGKYTKTKQPRITFMSIEAESYLKPILDKIGPDKLVFGTNENSLQATQNEETYFLRLRERAGLNEKYDSGTNKVTIHTLRSYFVTKCEKINQGLGHSLAGHDRYMQEYDRFNEQELLEFYLKAEPELIISNEERLRQENRLKDERINDIESKKDERIAYLEKQVEEIRKGLQQYVKVNFTEEIKVNNSNDQRIYFPVKLVASENPL